MPRSNSGFLGWAIVKGLIVPPKKKKKRRNARHKFKHRRVFEVSSTMTRFRQREMPGDGLGQNLTASTVLGTYRTYTNGVLTSTTQQLLSTNPSPSQHFQRVLDEKHPGPPYRTGGPFKAIEYHIPTSERKGYGTYTSDGNPDVSPNQRFEYKGDFFPSSDWGSDNSNIDYVNYGFKQLPNLSAYHTKAFDQLKPTIPKASASQFIYELKDLPRMLVTSANLLHNSWRSFGGGYSTVTMHPSSVADNFLNHEFGWVPFINDLQRFLNTFESQDQHINRITRENGIWIRRRRVLEESETTTLQTRSFITKTQPTSNAASLTPCLRLESYGGSMCRGWTDITETSIVKVWAVGQFTFYRIEFDDKLPSYSDQVMNVRRLLTLYGARINPTVLWKITPWSWLIDWFTNLGSYIQRVDDLMTDGIVSRYLYVMRSESKVISKICHFNFYSGPRTLIWQRRLKTKQREAADSPYGFNTPWNTLSAEKWAILGAVGISRTNSGFISRGA